MHLVMIGGSDAGISAALRARELDPAAEVTVVLEDAYPNFSICGIPYYLSGEVAHWRNLAHRSLGDLEAAGMRLRLDTTARRIDVPGRKLLITSADGGEELLGYDKLIVGTGAVPVRPPIGGVAGPGALGPAEGVHLLHSMGDTFAVMATLEQAAPASAVIVGAGYIGLEMADALTVRGLQVTQMEQLPEVLPTVDPELGALVHAELAAHGVEVLTGTTVRAISKAPPGRTGRLEVQATAADGTAVTRATDMVLVVVGVRPETTLAADAGATLGIKGAITVDPGMRTGLPDVLAAGDCVITHHRLLGVTYLPLGTTAHKQGRVAGENAAGGNREFAGSLGTQVVKIFDQAAARTGLRDHEAAPAGFDPVTIGFEADDHKAYYPGSHRITMRVTGDRGHRPAARPAAVRPPARRDRQAHRHRRRRDLHRHDRRRGQRPGPVLHPAAGQPLGRGPDGRPGLAPGHPAALTRPGSSSRGTAMSGHNTGPGPQPHHTRHPAIRAAAAAIILLALGACSSTTTSTASTTASAVPSGGPGILTGAGSTYVAPFFALAFARYHQQHPAVTVNYSAVGSSAGIAAISAQQVDFGASDVPMNASELAAAKGGPVTQVPDALGAEGIAYNLNLPAGARLHLTGPVLAAIFLGQITHWNDPAITALNPGITLPAASITVVHRSDGSGTTYIFSNYLSSVDPAWAAKVGTGKTLNWPVGEGAEGNGSVTSTVFRTPFSIGYVEQAYSQGLLLPFAEIRNQAGNYVLPSTQTIAAAAAQKPVITPTDFSIVNQPGASSYPISGYSWALIYTHQASQATGQALVTMLDWLTHDGQAYAAANLYVPLPAQVRQLALTMLQQVTGPSGAQLLS